MIELLTQPAEVLLVKKALAEYANGFHSNLTDDAITYQQLQASHTPFYHVPAITLLHIEHDRQFTGRES